MIRRGEIYWLRPAASTGSEQAGMRPALVVQNDVGNSTSPTTIIATITSQRRRHSYPFHVRFTSQESGLRMDGIVMCEQIQTVHQTRLGQLIGKLDIEKMQDVDLALHHSLGLEQPQ